MLLRRLVVVLLLVLPAAEAPAHAVGPAASKIVFVSNRDTSGDLTQGDVYELDSTTGALARLSRTDQVYGDGELAVSPDGSRVAYAINDASVLVAEADGSGSREVPGCDASYALSFSPDGQQLACGGASGNKLAVATVDIGTGAMRTLALGSDPAWSSDGARIAFLDAGNHPAFVPVQGGATQLVSSATVDNYSGPALVWSPDSHRLAFVVGDVGEPQSLWIVNTAGHVLHRVHGVGDVPSWSPDGKTVAAVDTRTHQVVLVDAATSRKRQLTREHVSLSAPSWSPDGRRLAFLRSRPLLGYGSDSEEDIVTIGRDGRGRRPLTSPFPNGGAISSPIWTRGALVGGMRPPRVRVLPLHPTRETTVGDQVDNVVADAYRAATVIYLGCVAVVWDERSGSRTAVSSCDPQDTDTETMFDDTVTGARFAWLQLCNCRYGDDSALLFRNVQDKRDVGSLYSADPGKSSPTLGNIVGQGGLIAFDLIPPGGSPQLWTVPPGTRSADVCPLPQIDPNGYGSNGVTGHDCKRLLSGDGADALDVDGGRVLAQRPDGTLLVLDAAGDKVVQSWQFAPNELTGAALSGAQVVVSSVDELRVYDVATGALRATWRLPTDLTTPRLRDANGGLAVYARGPAIHVVRLTDGRDVGVYARGQGEQPDAAIEPQGLYYAYNMIGRLKPGRLAFVPRAQLLRQLAAAH